MQIDSFSGGNKEGSLDVGDCVVKQAVAEVRVTEE